MFAVAVEKSKTIYGEAAVEKATEEICRRFDIYLQRHYHNNNDAQRGLLIFSEGRFDARAKAWVRGFREKGTKWGAINNLADIPYFASMRDSRLLQLADLIAHATWLMYERGDATLFKQLVKSVDAQEGVLHGLSHVKAEPKAACECPVCHSKRTPGDFGPWLK